MNKRINVQAPPYNAKGDCATDDHDAILAAMNAANASYPAGNGRVPPAARWLLSDQHVTVVRAIS